MKKLKHLILPSILALILSVLFSCAEEEARPIPNPGRAEVRFEQEQRIIGADAGPVPITIKLDKAMTRNGVIILSVSANHSESFRTEPSVVENQLELFVAEGQQAVTFLIEPLGLQGENQAQEILFQIASVTEGIVIGTPQQMTVRLVSEGSLPDQATVQFAKTEESILENGSGTDIAITFDQPARQPGMITVKVESANPDWYTLSPAPEESTIRLPVNTGQQHVTLSVIPVNDAVASGDKLVTFILAEVSEAMVIGAGSEFRLTIQDDDAPAIVNFLNAEGSVRENSSAGWSVVMQFSQPAPGDGWIEVAYTSDQLTYGMHFSTTPAAEQGKIQVPVMAGTHFTKLHVYPIDDPLFNGYRNLTFSIVATQGAVIKGDLITYSLQIIDDELTGMPRSMETAFPGVQEKLSYLYNAQGKLHQVRVERNNQVINRSYQYDGYGFLVRVSEGGLEEIRYTRAAHGGISKAETYRANKLHEYRIFSYDNAGQIGEEALFERQSSGEFELTRVTLFLYYTHGSLFKRMIFVPEQNNESDFTLASEETFNYHIGKQNDFPMVEIVPDRKAQLWLVSDYQLTVNGVNRSFSYDYTYDEKGRAVQRTTQGKFETVSYAYYE